MNYWDDRDVRRRKNLLNRTIADIEKELSIHYKDTAKEVVLLIKDLYLEISKNEQITINHLYRYNKYYEMLDKLNKELKRLGKKEYLVLNKNFRKMYKANERALNQSFNLSSSINKSALNKVIDEYWLPDKLNWSARLWRNKSLLNEALKKGLFLIIATGKTTDDLVKELMTSFNQSYNNAKRLVVTETNHILIESTIEKYKEAGLEKYRFLTAEDEKVCEECGDLDGKVFPLKDKKHLPPAHANCRCSVLGVIE